MRNTEIDDVVGPADDVPRFIRWRQVVRHVLVSLGGEADFQTIIHRIEELVPARWLYCHWEAKAAFILRTDRNVEKVGRDRWRLRLARSPRDNQ